MLLLSTFKLVLWSAEGSLYLRESFSDIITLEVVPVRKHPLFMH